MNQNEMKKRAAAAALPYVKEGSILGVGTGSTVNFFIDLLAEKGIALSGAISSSEASTARLRDHNFPLVELADVDKIGIYVDGADETNRRFQLIKGGGGALTREKIVAAASTTFVCIVDESKTVETLGAFPLPVEIIPMAARQVAASLREFGGEPTLREGFVTDNGNLILDVHGLKIDNPVEMESEINQLAGVVTVGLFAIRPADVVVVGTADGVNIWDTPHA